ncbi:hypothetical protein [Pseudaminobacter soli (ex Zhang et al. 2022)]|uniref:hypothetical protein n=1 Tax=Pseudaminobacter soli (ex Zhang et al. 2022) TaxID=2831468 RepID=UPI001F272DEC|nr:hypothetical protein [Pseudaminobacter soli]
MIWSTKLRVAAHSDSGVNLKLQREMKARIAYFAQHPEEIPRRLEELDQEWDIERAIEANASSLAFAGLLLGTAVDRRWLALPAVVTGFLFQHAIQGWCPPVPVLRRLGFRTADEINQERYALRALRGDFSLIERASNKVAAVLNAIGLSWGPVAESSASAEVRAQEPAVPPI